MLLLLLLTFAAGPLQTPAASATDLSWLAGCWELTRNGRHVVEQWSRPDGSTLIGTSRTVAGGKTVEYEFLLIRENAGALEYVAKPSGQAEAAFRSTRASGSEVVFENPAHDFPQRITYMRNADGSLLAAIEGTVNGQSRRLEFPYSRAACAGD